MKNRILALFLLTVIVATVPILAQDGRGGGNKAADLDIKNGEVLYKQSYALLIGNSEYSEWSSLPGVERDLPLVETVLRDKHGFTVEKAINLSRDELRRRIDQFISKYGQNYDNRLVIYYAGHGYTSLLPDGRVMGYLVMKDAPIVPEVESSLQRTPANLGDFRLQAISMDEIENKSREIATRHALFVFDSCFSGSVLYRDNSINIPDEISPEELKPVRAFLTAGTEKQRVNDNSPFRRAFIDGLEGKADLDRDGYILGTELGSYVKTEVHRETRGTPALQTPIFGKQERFSRGDMVFVSPRAASVASKTPRIAINPTFSESKSSEKIITPNNQNFETAVIDYGTGKLFKIGSGAQEFITEWTSHGENSIYAVGDNLDGIANSRVTDFDSVGDFTAYDRSSRVRVIDLNQIAVLRNKEGFYALVQVFKILKKNSQIHVRFKIVPDKKKSTWRPDPSKYVSKSLSGQIKFSYANNNSDFIIGHGGNAFPLQFGPSGGRGIRLYNDDGISIIHVSTDSGVEDSALAKSSSTVSAKIRNDRRIAELESGDRVVIQNKEGVRAVIRILDIKMTGSSYDTREVVFEYKIF